MKYSFVIPIYNGKEYVPRLLNRLFAQSYSDWEAFFVDDESSDGTADLLRCLCHDSRISIIQIEHSGVSAARNAGLEKASGDYIIFWDHDDLISPDLLSIVEENQEEADVLIFNFENIENQKSQIAKFEKPFYYNITDCSLDCFLVNHYHVIAGSVWNKVFKKSIIDLHQLRFIDERLVGNEDILFCLQYYLRCETIQYTDKIGYQYYHRLDSLSHRTFCDTSSLQAFLDCALIFMNCCKPGDSNVILFPFVFLYKEIMLGYRSYLGTDGAEIIIRYLHENLELPLLHHHYLEASKAIIRIEQISADVASLVTELFLRILTNNWTDGEALFTKLLASNGKKRRVEKGYL